MRFRLALKQHGVEKVHQDFYRGWVLGWIKFIKPRKFDEGDLEDVRGYLSHLGTSGRKGWQVHQAAEALRILFQDVEPRAWAREWPEDLVRFEPLDLRMVNAGFRLHFEPGVECAAVFVCLGVEKKGGRVGWNQAP